MVYGDDQCESTRERLVKRYLNLTKQVMPDMAREQGTDWPVVNDHCFQRIALDAVAGGVWYDHFARPAYKHLTESQAATAVALCERIINGSEDLTALNLQSLRWRGKLRP